MASTPPSPRKDWAVVEPGDADAFAEGWDVRWTADTDIDLLAYLKSFRRAPAPAASGAGDSAKHAGTVAAARGRVAAAGSAAVAAAARVAAAGGAAAAAVAAWRRGAKQATAAASPDDGVLVSAPSWPVDAARDDGGEKAEPTADDDTNPAPPRPPTSPANAPTTPEAAPRAPTHRGDGSSTGGAPSFAETRARWAAAAAADAAPPPAPRSGTGPALADVCHITLGARARSAGHKGDGGNN